MPLLDLKRNELRDVVLAPIAQQLADIDAEMAPLFDAISTALHEAETESQVLHPGSAKQHQGYSPDDRLHQGQN